MPISVEQLLYSYGSYLRAKVQEMEMMGFIGVSFRKTIAEHEELEAAYILQMKARRAAESEAFKARLEGVEKAEKKR